MSAAKKQVRARFREVVFRRDGHSCAMCGAGGPLDAHHITDRNLFPNGGYVLENGISLCAPCHAKAEVFHSTGTAVPGFSVKELYRKIRSSLAAAQAADKRNGP